MHTRRRIRQNQWFANLEILDRKRTTLEKLHASFEHHFEKRCRGKDDMSFDLVIFEESHVTAVELRRPGGRRMRHPHFEQSTPAWGETAVAPMGGFVPPTRAIPCISRQCQEPPAGIIALKSISTPARCRSSAVSITDSCSRSRRADASTGTAAPSRLPKHSW